MSPSTPYGHSHEPSTPLIGLVHLRRTILWAVLPEVLFFTLFSLVVVVISRSVHSLDIANGPLLNTYSTILSLLLTFKTTAALASYQEGRRLWYSVILASRAFSRASWIGVPDCLDLNAEKETVTDTERRTALVEKKTYINLLGAFSIALKHYVRGEAGPYYVDLWPLINFLPRYRLPPSDYFGHLDLGPSLSYATPPFLPEPRACDPFSPSTLIGFDNGKGVDSYNLHAPLLGAKSNHSGWHSAAVSESGVPMVRVDSSSSSTTLGDSPAMPQEFDVADAAERGSYRTDAEGWARRPFKENEERGSRPYTRKRPPHKLLPARNPPPRSIGDHIPFWNFFADLLAWLSRLFRRRKTSYKHPHRSRHRRGCKAVPIACRRDGDNVPLEIILVLSGYIAALERRKTIEASTISALYSALQQLSEVLTGLERILLAPMPVAYSLLLQHAIWIFLLLLPSHLHSTLGWLTIPATALCTFLFIGFLRLGEQIENPLGYDDSDLDLEVYVNIVLKELREMCTRPEEEWQPSKVAFVEGNRPFASRSHLHELSAPQIIALSIPIANSHEQLRAAGGADGVPLDMAAVDF